MERLYDDSLCLWAENEVNEVNSQEDARSPPSRPSDESESDGNPDDSEEDANEVNSQRGSPTATTSPTSPESDRTVPSKALVTSTVALSDWTRHSRSYCLTASPGRTNHSTISPSLRPSPVCRWDGGRGERGGGGGRRRRGGAVGRRRRQVTDLVSSVAVRHGVGCGGASSPGHLSPPTAPRTSRPRHVPVPSAGRARPPAPPPDLLPPRTIAEPTRDDGRTKHDCDARRSWHHYYYPVYRNV